MAIFSAGWLELLLMMNGVRVAVAAWCIPTSPSGCSATCNAVGATNKGKSRFKPSTVVRVSTVVGSTAGRGTISTQLEGVAIAANRELRIGAVRGVVVDGLRDVGVEHRLEIENRGHLGEAGNAPMIAKRAGVALGGQERRPGDQRRQAQQRVASCRTSAPSPFDRPHHCLPTGRPAQPTRTAGGNESGAGRTLRCRDGEVNARPA